MVGEVIDADHPARRRWLTLAAAFVVALAFSSLRFVAAPGFEFYAGPVFYMLAWRWFGLKPALVVAAAVMTPTFFWWGHPVSIALAIGHVFVIDRWARGRHSFSTITLFYQGLFGAAIGVLFLSLTYASPIEVSAIVIARKVLCELVLAGAADAIVLFFRYDPRRVRIVRNEHLSLQFSIDALVSNVVACAATLFLLGQLNGVTAAVQSINERVSHDLADWPGRTDSPAGRSYPLRINDEGRVTRVFVASAATWRADAARLGCERFDTGGRSNTSDRNTFTYWLHLCVTGPLPGARVAIVPMRSMATAMFGDIGRRTAPLLLFLFVAQVALMVFRRAIQRSLDDWVVAIGKFRARETIDVRPTRFAETAELQALFATASNDYLEAERERARLARAVTELRATMDLKLFSDVVFDPDECALRFVKLDPTLGRRDIVMRVTSADRAAFQSVGGQNDIMVEFRMANSDGDDWYLLLAHDHDAQLGGWRYGCVIRLRTAKAFQTQMRHNARLMELGGMASALSHELRQPLFTIALAAENGGTLLDRMGDAVLPARRKFDRIVEQVERATAIIQRTSTYARIERDEREPTDLLQTVQNAARFMRAVVQERDIHLSIVTPDTLPTLMLPRVGVEQILVNALQNAADSIEAARALRVSPAPPDRITVRVEVGADAIGIAIEDTGAGLHADIADSAFQAFSTTKPAGKGTGLGLFVCRQIIDEVGGTITLADNVAKPGATLRMQFPKPSAGLAAAA